MKKNLCCLSRKKGNVVKKKSRFFFKDYSNEWVKCMETRLLPSLRRAMDSCARLHKTGGGTADAAIEKCLCKPVTMLQSHFMALLELLDVAVLAEPIHCLAHNPLRDADPCSSLWLGGCHPYLFSALLHVLLNYSNRKPTMFDLSWAKGTSKAQKEMAERVEIEVRAMTPALEQRFKALLAVDGAGKEDDMRITFLNGNSLRRSLFVEVMGETNLHQKARFLVGLASSYFDFSCP
ncbi:hypothetical protein AMTRI_Chr03g52230 [Amborella trichopoda]